MQASTDVLPVGAGKENDWNSHTSQCQRGARNKCAHEGSVPCTEYFLVVRFGRDLPSHLPFYRCVLVYVQHNHAHLQLWSRSGWLQRPHILDVVYEVLQEVDLQMHGFRNWAACTGRNGHSKSVCLLPSMYSGDVQRAVHNRGSLRLKLH